MEFLADQTIPEPSVEVIRALGNTLEIVPVETDDDRSDLLERAAREDRVLLTFEVDYYERIFEAGGPRPAGVVCFQMDWETARDPAQVLSAVLTDDDLSVRNQFTLLDEGRMRQKPLDDGAE